MRQRARRTRAQALLVAAIPGLEPELEVLRVKHYSIRTERAYCDWIRRYVRFRGMRSRDGLFPAGRKVEEFLSDLAVNGHVAVSTQSQAFKTPVILT